ncbi:MAG: hypothetical protein E5Y34_26685, partial [Mesorhizobium sp.]
MDLVRWETHSFPGVGIDAQDIINTQISDDYDIFIGIMWCRFGTPTKRAESGTIEEFLRAKTRYDKDQSSIKMMIYFKDEPLSPSKMNPEQLSKVNDFRESLGEEGFLYWSFKTPFEFEKFIRMHLTRQIQNFAARDNSHENRDKFEISTVQISHSNIAAESASDDDDLGLF